MHNCLKVKDESLIEYNSLLSLYFLEMNLKLLLLDMLLLKVLLLKIMLLKVLLLKMLLLEVLLSELTYRRFLLYIRLDMYKIQRRYSFDRHHH